MLDAIIVGAGPAGLTAAIYLSRFHRQAVVIDGGESRARWIPESHNIPGFSRGVGGLQFLAQLREQAVRYGADIHRAHADAITRLDSGFRVQTESTTLTGRFVVLATGVRDQLPGLPGEQAALLRGVLRMCPICDAFEVTGKRIAVIGSGAHAEQEARFLRDYSDSVTLVHIGKQRDSTVCRELESAGIGFIAARLEDLQFEASGLALSRPDGKSSNFDVAYCALGCDPMSDLALMLGADVDESGALRVNAHQQTTVEGLYAAGDLVRGLSQIVVAAAEAAIASADIHNRLRGAIRSRSE